MYLLGEHPKPLLDIQVGLNSFNTVRTLGLFKAGIEDRESTSVVEGCIIIISKNPSPRLSSVYTRLQTTVTSVYCPQFL